MFSFRLPTLGKATGTTERLERCTFAGCGATARHEAMADHWIIAQHYNPLLPAQYVRFASEAEIPPAPSTPNPRPRTLSDRGF